MGSRLASVPFGPLKKESLWAAREPDGSLWLFWSEPHMEDGEWMPPAECDRFAKLPEELLPGIHAGTKATVKLSITSREKSS